MKLFTDEKAAGVVIIEEKALTSQEKKRLKELEITIEQNLLGFVVVGLALGEINQSRLYRTKDGRTFDEYCLDNWGFNARRAYQLMKAAEVVQNVKNFTQTELQGAGLFLPKNEAQAAEMAVLPPEDQGPFWKGLVEKALQEDWKLTANKIKRGVKEFRGEKLTKSIKEAIEETSEKGNQGDEKKELMSDEFKAAWQALWEQVGKEQKANWRYTSKSLVHRRLSIIIEAIENTGLHASYDSKEFGVS